MLHNIDDNDASTATLTLTTTSIATTTTNMSPTETTGNGTEPTISTHLANVSATIAPTTIISFTANATEQETVVTAVASAAPTVAPASTTVAAKGHATATMTVTSNNTINAAALLTPTPTSTPLPLSAVAEQEIVKTADLIAPGVAATVGIPSTNTEPTFDVQMRTQQQQKIKIYHGAKQSAVWRTDSLASNPSPIRSEAGSTEFVAATVFNRVSGGAYSTAPSLLQRKFSDGSLTSAGMPRRVSFPESDKELVTGYLEPANPWEQVCQVSNIAEISELYEQSCRKHHTTPLKCIQDHLKALDLHLTRQPLLSLKGIKITPNDCEPLEEIFKRIQYKIIDLSECPLDENCLSALCQMIEYYEAANELDISYNKEEMTLRGWNLCTYMVGRSHELQLLNAEGNQISKLGAENLGGALKTSNLHTLKLEHCGLKGPPLSNFCCKLYHNKNLKELWLGYNDLDCTDAQNIADMLRFNHTIELIDISNNNICDEGVMYLVQALILQATELERRSALPLQRAQAIQDDEPGSPFETTAPMQLANVSEECIDQNNSEAPQIMVAATATAAKDVLETVIEQQQSPKGKDNSTNEPAVGVLVDVDNDADDDNTEDTVRTLRSGNQSATGQSMLDKLLSMNSDSSSEDATSNISTDTLAACCSEDISEISNEIYDANTKLQAAATAISVITTDDSSTAFTETTNHLAATVDSFVLEQLTPAQQEQLEQQQNSQNERNLCDITPSTEAKTVEPNETCVQNNNNANSHNNNANTNNNNINNNLVISQIPTTAVAEAAVSSSSATSIFEVTAEESDCINGMNASGPSGSRPVDMNKNSKAADDFEDTHSTDSAFESASEGDISRHLPDDFCRLSVSLESTRLDDMTKDMAIETATIASESTECLLVAEDIVTPALTPTPVVCMQSVEEADVFVQPAPKVTIAADCLTVVKDKEYSTSPCPSPTPTPPPPSTSPGGASIGLRRTESSCAYLNQSTRNRSQSSDSLCSDNSLDGSVSAADPHLAEKLTKNDTLSRRQLVDATLEAANRAPSGLKALALWSNNLTKNCGPCIAELLSRSSSLELLNIGKNCLSNDFVATIKDSLTKNTTLTTLGLQSAHLSAKGIETLASILTFGGNSKLQRIDIRDNKLEVESLNIIAEVLKSNKTITQIDINDEPKRLTLPIVPIVNVTPPTPLPQESIGSDAHMDYTRVLGTVRSMCSRNEKLQAEELELAEKAATVGGGSNSSNNSSNGNNVGSINNRCRGGYYLGSRKISLTCHSRPLVDASTGTVTGALAVTAMPTPAAKLEVKRKNSARLRSPGPSPPTISPSSSPNRSRFHVSRVNEIGSPLTSPLAQMPPQHTPTPRTASSCMSIPMASGSTTNGGINSNGLLGSQSSLNAISVLPTSSSLPSMASVTSSTQTIKRLSVSPRSRFHVSRIYEDPHTPPINLPPTPMLKSARKAAVQLAEAAAAAAIIVPSATSTTTDTQPTEPMPISSVIIVEPIPTVTAVAASNDNAHLNCTNAVDGTATHKLLPQFVNNSPSTSSSSCSTSPISSTTNSSSSSNDITDSSCCSAEPPPVPVAKICPIAVFGDNDITLTKDSAAGVVLSAAAANNADGSNNISTESTIQQPAARARKSSWIANPTTVDKLLTLFNPSSMFQRSSSPESKANIVSAPPPNAAATATFTNNAQNTTNTTTTTTTGGAGDVIATRKTTPPSRTNNTSGNSYHSTAGIGNTSTGAAAVAPETIGGSISFLDTASRQLRDFGKQVFRQNLSFNNGNDGANTTAQLENPVNPSPITQIAGTSATPECLKRELHKQNSPEHTINEETPHKLTTCVEDANLKAEDITELDDIEIVMHSEVSDCISTIEQQQQEQQDLGQV